MHKVFISAKLSPEGVAVLNQGGLEVTESAPLNGSELIKALQGYDALIVRSESKVTQEVIAACPQLKVIGRAGTGVDNIDVDAATAHGVIVMNAPGGNTITTAEHSFALMLSAARMIPQAHKKLVDGTFDRKHKGVELEGKTLGIIGMGQIGRVLTRKAIGFGMNVIGYDPYCPEEIARGLNVELLPLKELFGRSDIISIHVPKTDETANLINASTIDQMKNGAIVVNCARGGLVDEDALYQALESGKLAAAALDVYATEPPSPDNPLIGHPKCVTTPHLGASTEEAQVNVAIIVAQEIVDYLQEGAVRGAINLPALSPQAYEKLRPFIELGHQLGSFVAQASRTDAIDGFSITYAGDIAQHNTDYILRSALSGYLKHRSDDANNVNAPSIAKRLGMSVSEVHAPQTAPGLGSLRIALTSKLGERSAEGIVYTKETTRMTSYDGIRIDAPVHGTILLTRNDDVPGVIGTLGSYLGTTGINIAAFHLGRRASGGEAIALIEIDSVPTQVQLSAIEELPNIKSVKLVRI